MNKLIILTVLAVLATSSITANKPLRAMLYCWLPAVDKNTDPMPEYNKLADLINQKLRAANINVVVDVCDPNGNGNNLYNASAIDTLFDDHEILEVDVSYLWAIQTPLLGFSRDEIRHYDKVYPFEWTPTTTIIDQKQVIVGSPGLLCSDFLETRSNGGFTDRLYADYSVNQTYALVSYYLNAYINGAPGRTLEDIDYTSVDSATIKKVAKFLKSCQTNQQTFDYSNNWCLNFTGTPFFQTKYDTTVGYSENLYVFQNAGVPTKDTKIQHVTKTWPKKVFYIDSFVTKATVTDRETVLKFYEFMLTDSILDIYIKGLYTLAPKTTYLLPPTVAYLNNLVKKDVLYKEIYKSAFENAQQYPIFQQSFADNVYNFAVLVDNALQGLNGDEL